MLDGPLVRPSGEIPTWRAFGKSNKLWVPSRAVQSPLTSVAPFHNWGTTLTLLRAEIVAAVPRGAGVGSPGW